MSVDQESERSLLERKDRNDLVAMATALGEKPPARAKKASIVDLILRLTNVPPASPAGGDAAGDVASTAGQATRPLSGPAGGASPPSGADAGPSAAAGEDGAGTAGRSPFDPSAAAGQGEAGRPLGETGDTAAAEAIDVATGGGDGEDDGRPAGVGRADGAAGGNDVTPARDRPPAAGDANGRSDGDDRPRRGDAGRQPSTPSWADPQAQGPGAAPADVPDGQSRSRGERSPGPGDRGQGPGQPQGPRPGQANGNRAGQPGPSPAPAPSDRANGEGQPGPGNAGPGNGAGPGNAAGQGTTDRANQAGPPGPRPEDGEGGNRRRRRRGRDRDRPGNEVEEGFSGEPIDVEGLLDLRDEGYGFLRVKGYLPSRDDVYVSVKQARQFALRKGDRLAGKSRPANRNERNPALLQIDAVNGVDPERARERPLFEDLTPLFPDQKLRLERADDPANMTSRIVDLIAPVGKGQRGLIVSPPKAGKTTVMKQIARSIEMNNPEVELIVLLVDERPEEVTDMKRWLKRGEVAASTFDRPSEEHTQVAEIVIERAKRMVEDGKDVVIILDGITRLARAYNLAAPATGRIMSGGIDTGALYPPKKFFGAARNVEEGGSLTILATALVETGSRMDEVIFEEFKGTGNMELKLDRRLADRRIYPAIDVDASSTRHEELLFERKQLQQVWRLRRVLHSLSAEGAGSAAGLELLIDRMKTFKSNDEFLAEVAKAASV